nr:cytochrome P450 76C3-like [Coffea arabica]
MGRIKGSLKQPVETMGSSSLDRDNGARNGTDRPDSKQLREVLWGVNVMKMIGAPNVVDFFPVLKVIDVSQPNEADWHSKDMKYLFLGLFVVGTDTIAELLRNLEMMRKATSDIREVIGLGKFVQESDISRVPYLDKSLWPNPHSFLLARFLDSEIDVKGQHFELLAFGTERRICLELPLAHRMVHLMLASLLHNFDWKLEDGDKSRKHGHV